VWLVSSSRLRTSSWGISCACCTSIRRWRGSPSSPTELPASQPPLSVAEDQSRAFRPPCRRVGRGRCRVHWPHARLRIDLGRPTWGVWWVWIRCSRRRHCCSCSISGISLCGVCQASSMSALAGRRSGPDRLHRRADPSTSQLSGGEACTRRDCAQPDHAQDLCPRLDGLDVYCSVSCPSRSCTSGCDPPLPPCGAAGLGGHRGTRGRPRGAPSRGGGRMTAMWRPLFGISARLGPTAHPSSPSAPLGDGRRSVDRGVDCRWGRCPRQG